MLAVGLGAAVAAGTSTANGAIQLFSGSSSSGTADGPFAFATDVYVTNTAGITLTSLGIFDDGAPGSLVPSPTNPTTGTATTGFNGSTPTNGLSIAHRVAIYNTATNTVLASATIPAGTSAALSDGFRFVSISPLFVPYNTSIAIVAYDLSDAAATGTAKGDDFGESPTTLPGGSLSLFGETYSQTNATTGIPTQYTANRFYSAGNVQYVNGNAVPEPASLGLIGLAAVGMLGRRRSRGTAK